MNPTIIRFPPKVDTRQAPDEKPPSLAYRVLEFLAFPAVVLAIIALFAMIDSEPGKSAPEVSYLPNRSATAN